MSSKNFIDELNKESDRGAVLVAVTMLDDLLEQIIMEHHSDR